MKHSFSIIYGHLFFVAQIFSYLQLFYLFFIDTTFHAFTGILIYFNQHSFLTFMVIYF